MQNLEKLLLKNLEKLVQRTYDLMMGRIKYKNMFFKLDDPDGNYFNIKHKVLKMRYFLVHLNVIKK